MKMPILIAEDGENDFLLIQRAFVKAGVDYPLIRTVDGEETIAYLAGEGKYADRTKFPVPWLMLLDLKMPKVSGFEVLEWVRMNELARRLLILVLSSSRQTIDINRAYDLGANSYLVKPIEFNRLQELVGVLCRFWGHMSQKPCLDTEYSSEFMFQPVPEVAPKGRSSGRGSR